MGALCLKQIPFPCCFKIFSSCKNFLTDEKEYIQRFLHEFHRRFLQFFFLTNFLRYACRKFSGSSSEHLSRNSANCSFKKSVFLQECFLEHLLEFHVWNFSVCSRNIFFRNFSEDSLRHFFRISSRKFLRRFPQIFLQRGCVLGDLSGIPLVEILSGFPSKNHFRIYLFTFLQEYLKKFFLNLLQIIQN